MQRNDPRLLLERASDLLEERIADHPAREALERHADDIFQCVCARIIDNYPNMTERERVTCLTQYLDEEIADCLDQVAMIPEGWPAERATYPVHPSDALVVSETDASPVLSVRSRFTLLYKRRTLESQRYADERPTGAVILEDLCALQRACDPEREELLWLRLTYEIDALARDPGRRAADVSTAQLGALYGRLISGLPGPAVTDSNATFLAELGVSPYNPGEVAINSNGGGTAPLRRRSLRI